MNNSINTSVRRRWLSAVALVAAFAAGGLTMTAVVATAQTGAPHHMMMVMGGGAHGDMHAHIGKVLDDVGATADQKAKIEQILHAGMKPMMEAHDMGALHQGLKAALTGPTVDRAVLEQLRADEMAKLDRASRAMTQALADAADVLRPDQRAKLAAQMADQHEHSDHHEHP